MQECKHSFSKRRFQVSGLQIFRIGDIVEVQASFIVVPLKNQNLKMHMVLHSIALLDGQFTKVRT